MKQTNSNLRRATQFWAALLTLTFIAFTLAIPRAYAQERYWDRGAGTDLWGTSGNWSAVLEGDGAGAPGVPGQNNRVFFSATPIQGDEQNVTHTTTMNSAGVTTLAGTTNVTLRSNAGAARQLQIWAPADPGTPSPASITSTLNGNELVLQWPNGQGWQLQVQTNSLNVGISTNWSTISGATSPFTTTINAADPTVFYRLSYSPIVLTDYESITHNGTGSLNVGAIGFPVTVQFRNNTNPNVKTNTIANNSAGELLFPNTVQALGQPAGDTITATALRNAGTGTGDVRFSGTIGRDINALIQDSATSRMVLAGQDYNGGNNDFFTWNGPVLINKGTLALVGGANIGAVSDIYLAGGATYDVSGRTVSPTLAAGQALKVTGSASAGTTVVDDFKDLGIGSGRLEFTAFNGINAPLTVTGATGGFLLLGADAVVTVNTTSNLAVGTYKLIAKSGSGAVSQDFSGPPAFATLIGADNFGTLSISDGELFLVVIPGYPVTYNGNNNDLGTAPANQTKGQGIDLTLASNSGNLARSGFAFAGWNTQADGLGTDYAEGATYSTDAALTLFAKWTAATTYTITYDGNGNTGGTAPEYQIKVQGVPLTLASNSGNLVRVGKAFGGWNTAADGSGTDYAEGATYTADASVTLYANWVDYEWLVTAGGAQQWQTAANWNPALVPNGDAITVNITNTLEANQNPRLGFELGLKTIGTMNLGSPGNDNSYNFGNDILIFQNSLTGTGTINIIPGINGFGKGQHYIQGQINMVGITNFVINNNGGGGERLAFIRRFFSSDPNNDITMTINGVPGSGQVGMAGAELSAGPNMWRRLVINGPLLFVNNFAADDRVFGRPLETYLADALTLMNGATIRPGGDGNWIISENRGITLGVGGGRINSATPTRHWVVNSIITGTGELLKTGAGDLTLNAANTYDGPTTIQHGRLILGANASIANSPVIHLAVDTNEFVAPILDVSGRSSTLTLGNAQTLKTSGTLFFTPTITMADGKGVAMGDTSGLEFVDVDSTGFVAPLTVDGDGGSLTLAAGNVVTVTPTSQLAVGSYKLIAKGFAGATVAGTAPTSVTVNGAGSAGSSNSLSIIDGELILTVNP
jgi:autotransporter-associated beta strand protein